jgi:hemolysin III
MSAAMPDPRAPRATPPPGAPDPEWPNVVTHGVGLVAAVVGTAVLIVLAATGGDPWTIVAVAIYGASLVALYAASTGYHAARRPALKRRLQVADHAAIHLLIAGTYTPFVLGVLRGGWGWSLFGVIWGLTAVGVVFKLFATGRFTRLSTALYLGKGWLVVLAAGPLLRALSPGTLALLVAGGVAYTAGTPFYLADGMRHNHAVWHVFVLLGSACHAVAVGTLIV